MKEFPSSLAEQSETALHQKSRKYTNESKENYYNIVKKVLFLIQFSVKVNFHRFYMYYT